MDNYKHILIAEDYSKGSAKIREKAINFAKKYKAKVSVLHVVESLSDYIKAMLPNIEEKLIKEAQKNLKRIYKKYNISDKHLFSEEGVAKATIVSFAEKHQVDLIIVGSHGAHRFFEHFLGSTADGVLHKAECDVLVVKV